ncbi:MAG: UMP kinase [Thermoplasmatales archaeon]|nr:UMP kinase [Thermoplasmatales archaeon]
MEKVVVSIGGSVLVPGKDDAAYIKSLAGMLGSVSKKTVLAVVCGGGKVARYYSKTGGELGGTVDQLDEMGIAVTRINASLLRIALGDTAANGAPTTAGECAGIMGPGKVAVMGGTAPGHTTDAVAAMVAREIGADRIVNASNVDAVYDCDPRTNPGARRMDRMTIKELSDIVYDEHEACKSSVFDPLGCTIAMEEGIDLVMVDGRDLAELENAILGKPVKGTFIDSSRRG